MRTCFGVEQVICLKKQGDIVIKYQDNSDRFLWVITCGKTEAEAMTSFEQALGKLELVTEGIGD